MSAKGRPEREYRSAQHEGSSASAMGRPEREYRSAHHEGSPVTRPLVVVGALSEGRRTPAAPIAGPARCP
jgi:hypothetical protein